MTALDDGRLQMHCHVLSSLGMAMLQVWRLLAACRPSWLPVQE